MRTAKILLTSRSQAVRLAKDFQFSCSEVFIRHDGENVMLSPRPQSWADYLSTGQVAPDDFMDLVEDLAVQAEELRTTAWQSAFKLGDEELNRGERMIYNSALDAMHGGQPVNPDGLP